MKLAAAWMLAFSVLVFVGCSEAAMVASAMKLHEILTVNAIAAFLAGFTAAMALIDQ